jgi:Domain of unknown function (DUF397)
MKNQDRRRPAPRADLGSARWYKSSHSASQGACVEVAHLSGDIGIRDSKDPDGPALVFGPEAFKTFLQAAQSGEFRPA